MDAHWFRIPGYHPTGMAMATIIDRSGATNPSPHVAGFSSVDGSRKWVVPSKGRFEDTDVRVDADGNLLVFTEVKPATDGAAPAVGVTHAVKHAGDTGKTLWDVPLVIPSGLDIRGWQFCDIAANGNVLIIAGVRHRTVYNASNPAPPESLVRLLSSKDGSTVWECRLIVIKPEGEMLEKLVLTSDGKLKACCKGFRGSAPPFYALYEPSTGAEIRTVVFEPLKGKEIWEVQWLPDDGLIYQPRHMGKEPIHMERYAADGKLVWQNSIPVPTDDQGRARLQQWFTKDGSEPMILWRTDVEWTVTKLKQGDRSTAWQHNQPVQGKRIADVRALTTPQGDVIVSAVTFERKSNNGTLNEEISLTKMSGADGRVLWDIICATQVVLDVMLYNDEWLLCDANGDVILALPTEGGSDAWALAKYSGGDGKQLWETPMVNRALRQGAKQSGWAQIDMDPKGNLWLRLPTDGENKTTQTQFFASETGKLMWTSPKTP